MWQFQQGCIGYQCSVGLRQPVIHNFPSEHFPFCWSRWYDDRDDIDHLKINVFMLNSTANGADGASQRMAYLDEVSWLQYCFWFFQTINRYFLALEILHLQAILQWQHKTCSHFDVIECTFSSAPENLSTYHKANAIRDNPRRTQVSLFHLHNIQARRTLSPLTIIWEETKLRVLYNSRTSMSHPGQNNIVIIDVNVCKVQKSRLRKLTNSYWGANATTCTLTTTMFVVQLLPWASQREI